MGGLNVRGRGLVEVLGCQKGRDRKVAGSCLQTRPMLLRPPSDLPISKVLMV